MWFSLLIDNTILSLYQCFLNENSDNINNNKRKKFLEKYVEFNGSRQTKYNELIELVQVTERCERFNSNDVVMTQFISRWKRNAIREDELDAINEYYFAEDVSDIYDIYSCGYNEIFNNSIVDIWTILLEKYFLSEGKLSDSIYYNLCKKKCDTVEEFEMIGCLKHYKPIISKVNDKMCSKRLINIIQQVSSILSDVNENLEIIPYDTLEAIYLSVQGVKKKQNIQKKNMGDKRAGIFSYMSEYENIRIGKHVEIDKWLTYQQEYEKTFKDVYAWDEWYRLSGILMANVFVEFLDNSELTNMIRSKECKREMLHLFECIGNINSLEAIDKAMFLRRMLSLVKVLMDIDNTESSKSDRVARILRALRKAIIQFDIDRQYGRYIQVVSKIAEKISEKPFHNTNSNKDDAERKAFILKYGKRNNNIIKKYSNEFMKMYFVAAYK